MDEPDNEPVPSLRQMLTRLVVQLVIVAVVLAVVVGALAWWAMGMLAGLGNGNGAPGE